MSAAFIQFAASLALLARLGIAVTCAGVALAVWKSRGEPAAAVD